MAEPDGSVEALNRTLSRHASWQLLLRAIKLHERRDPFGM